MSDSNNLKETAVSETQLIDDLKTEEKEKLSAAEEVYKKKTADYQEAAPVEQSVPETPHQSAHNKAHWLPGAILVGLGILFLLNNIFGLTINNWWALFILIPAVSKFRKAYDLLQSEGEFTRPVWSALAGGVLLSLLSAAMLFNLNWGLVLPSFLIIGGLALVLGALKE
jgi:hypothetical protein